jgi:prepilin-type N-terminal cleavage/methylation domain-containing protein
MFVTSMQQFGYMTGLSFYIVNTRSYSKRGRRGFTLLEIMCVMVIMGVVLALVGPSIGSFASRIGRKGAINTMMGTFEQARVAALTQGVTVHVAFAGDGFGDEYRYRSFMVLRERTDEDAPGIEFVPLTKWTPLPKGVSFVNEKNSLLGVTPIVTLPSELLPVGMSSTAVPTVTFNPSGAIETEAGKLRLMIYEGFDIDGKPNFSRKDRAYIDVINLRKYTGRAELYLTATAP